MIIHFRRNYIIIICIKVKNPTYKYTRSVDYIILQLFSSDNSDDAEMLIQMRLLYCRSNRVIGMFNKWNQNVLIELCMSFLYDILLSLFLDSTQKSYIYFSKLRVAYNNVYRNVFGLKRRSSASEMFV